MADTAVRSSSSNSAATGSALSVAAPAGVAVGDLVIVVCHINGQTTLVDNNGTTPFAEDLNDFAPNTTSGMTTSVFSRRIQTGDPSTYNFTGGASDRWSVVAIALSDPDPSTIYDVAIGTANTDAPPQAAVATIPSVTTVTDKSIHLAVGLADGAHVMTDTPAGYTLLESTGNQAIRAASKTITPAGATGTLTMTLDAADAVIGLSIAIKNNSSAGTSFPPVPEAALLHDRLNTLLRM